MYQAVLFVHVFAVVALILAVSYGTGGLVLAQRARDVDGVRRALAFVPLAERIFPVVIPLIPLAGLYLASRHGGDGSIKWGSGWLDVAIAVYVVMAGLGPTIEAKRTAAIREAAEHAGDGPLTPELVQRLNDPVLTHVSALGACQLGALLWLMTNKPGIGLSVLTVGVAALVSVGLGRLMLRAAGPAGVAAPSPAAVPVQPVVTE